MLLSTTNLSSSLRLQKLGCDFGANKQVSRSDHIETQKHARLKEVYLRIFSRWTFLWRFVALLREVLSDGRWLVAENVMHHFDIFPFAVRELNKFVLANLKMRNYVTICKSKSILVNKPPQCDKSAGHVPTNRSTNRELFRL